jgi:hypothetical protein
VRRPLLWLHDRYLSDARHTSAPPVAVLLATPHLYAYDFAVLMVSFAFLYRQRAFDNVEMIGIAAANVFIGAFLFFPTPIELVAIAIAVALIVRRVLQAGVQMKVSAVAYAA